MEKLFSQAQRQILWGTPTNIKGQQLGAAYPAKNQNNSNNLNQFKRLLSKINIRKINFDSIAAVIKHKSDGYICF